MPDGSTWLLTGGAGYIGAHIVHAFQSAGIEVVVLDDLSTGVRRKVPDGVTLVEASVLDTDRVAEALVDHGVGGVVHLAAKKAVGESVERPALYFRENVDGLLSLLDAMEATGVGRMVFSSSASVYGITDLEVVTEEVATSSRPVSPYGETKLIGEWLLRDLTRSAGLRSTSLRYFNAAGAGGPGLGDTGVVNLIPMTFQALAEGRPPQIFGGDWPTPDGTCIRDYIHVTDVADAHVAAARALDAGIALAPAYNLSRAVGVSVAEVMDTVREVTGIDFEPEVVGRRPGDPAHIVGMADAIARDLGWKAALDLHDMVSSAWEAWNAG
ncbi:MAG: UDP-glucose 4-epimerase GalE [Acidimicrobiales bacterium]